MLKIFSTYLSFSIINAGISFLISIYLARTLSYEDFGVVGLILSVLYFAIPMASFNTIGLIAINKVQLAADKFQQFANAYFTFLIIILAILIPAVFIGGLFIPEYKYIIYIIPMLIFFMAFGEFHNAELIQDHKSKTYGLFIFFTRLGIYGFTFMLIEYYGLSWIAYLWGMLAAEFVVLLSRLSYNFISLQKFKPSFDKTQMLNILAFGAPLIIALIAGWGLNQADRFIVLKYFSLKHVAFYTVAYSLGVIINTINQALTNTIVPTIYKAIKAGHAGPIIKKYTLIYAAIIVVIVLIFSLSAHFFIPHFYGQRYASSVNVSILIAIAFGFNGIYRVTGLVISYYKLNILQTKLVVISMLINVILSVILISDFGILAPAIGTIIAYMFLALASQYWGHKILKEKSEKSS